MLTRVFFGFISENAEKYFVELSSSRRRIRTATHDDDAGAWLYWDILLEFIAFYGFAIHRDAAGERILELFMGALKSELQQASRRKNIPQTMPCQSGRWIHVSSVQSAEWEMQFYWNRKLWMGAEKWIALHLMVMMSQFSGDGRQIKRIV